MVQLGLKRTKTLGAGVQILEAMWPQAISEEIIAFTGKDEG